MAEVAAGVVAQLQRVRHPRVKRGRSLLTVKQSLLMVKRSLLTVKRRLLTVKRRLLTVKQSLLTVVKFRLSRVLVSSVMALISLLDASGVSAESRERR